MSITPARRAAFDLLQRIDADDAYANLLLPQLVKRFNLDARDAALTQEIAFGTIRRRNTLEAIVLAAGNRKAGELDQSTLNLLSLGAYQLLLTRVPVHAAINETVEQAKGVANGRASGLVNAVLRRVNEKTWDEWLEQVCRATTNDTARLALKYSHPEWIITSLKLALGADSRAEDLELLLAADNAPPEINLVALPGLATKEDTRGFTEHPSSPIGFTIDSGNPALLEPVAQGRLRVQDAGSQLVALAVAQATDVKPGEKWLDLCAGPGGKSVLLAALAKQLGATLTCNEPAPHRAKLVADALSASKFNVEVRTEDGRDIRGTFDRILIDAPCTGLGALRRRPEARWRKQPSDVKQLSELQLQLVDSAWQTLKPGGVLIYSTCSPHPAETTAIIEASLRKMKETAELLSATQVLESISPTLRLTQGRKTAQLWPHRDDTDAMFIAIIRKSVS